METVVFRSDIARLVLQYLQEQRLDGVSKLFCKSSPFLREEFNAYKHGFRAHSFFPALEEIICEYVKITQSVEKILSKLSDTDRTKLKEKTLSDKINEIFQVQDAAEKLQSSSANESAESYECYKENSSKKCSTVKRKRRKSTSCEYSSDAQPTNKRRRVSHPFCYLRLKQKHQYNKKLRYSTVESSGSEDYDDDHNKNATVDESDLSKLDVPKNESTPRVKIPKPKMIAKALPEITQAILDNSEFQQKLVSNINQALHNVESTNANGAIASEKNLNCAQQKVPTPESEAQEIITSNQLLDEMVRNILEATEQDPSFDAIIEEVVGASNKQTAHEDAPNGMPLTTSASTSLLSKNQTNNFSKPAANSGNSVNNVILPTATSAVSATTGNQIVPPRTPLIIRHAVASASTSSQGDQPNAIAQLIPQAGQNNNSFNVFMDPSFSISKLVVMNPNDSSQKQPPQAEQSAISIGNTTCEHILNHLNAGEVPTEEQVFFDVSTGQLAFPLYLINDGITGTLPFVNNNEVVMSTNMANMTTHCISAPGFTATSTESTVEAVTKSFEPVKAVNVNKLEGTEPLPQQNLVVKTVNSSNPPVDPIFLEKATPSASGIINAKISKSLSTPRKRASHVRTLSFSPANSSAAITSSGATPLSTRRQVPVSRTRGMEVVLEENEKATTESLTLEKPVIRNVEILPQIQQNVTISNVLTANESSNSCSVPPLFAAEESTNQTIIKTELSLVEKCSCSSVEVVKQKDTHIVKKVVSDNTPKRKQSRRTAVRRCKRQLSKSSNEENTSLPPEASAKEEASIKTAEDITSEATKSKIESTQAEKKEPSPNIVISSEAKSEVNPRDEITIEEWKKLRSGTNNDLDARLRAINAKRIDKIQPMTKRDKKRKTRGKRGRAAAKRQKKLNQSTAAEDSEFIESPSKKVDEQNKPSPAELAKPSEILSKNESESDVSGEAEEKATVSTSNCNTKPSLVHTKDQMLSQAKAVEIVTVVSEAEKRTANIGYLLETPFKDGTSSGGAFLPPTPGIFMPSLDTPLSKLKTQDNLLESASYLFGSLTKSELGTPLLSAITPGFRFTPLVAKDTATPHSVATTEYSSGGSYYRPDESEDLDRNIDKMLRDSAQKRQTGSTEDQMGMTPVHLDEVVMVDAITKPVENEICIEIPVETLKVAPIVLKRVKSFGVEDGVPPDVTLTSNTVPQIDPHYTLASGLPEICAEKEENADPLSMSATSSSSSSSTSSSSSSSSSSSDSSPSDSELETERKTCISSSSKTAGANTSKSAISKSLSIENLSEISSAEDDDWQKLEANNNPIVDIDEGNSQLIGNDGEVRYPVRSWLTPRKENGPTSQATIKMTLKSAEKCNRNTAADRRNAELALKRDRIKAKLREADQPKVKAKVRRPNAVTTSITNVQRKRQKTPATHDSQPSNNPEKDKTTVDVLTALNLSAKKKIPSDIISVPDITTTPVKMTPPGDADDNAMSNIFESTKESEKSCQDMRIISDSSASAGLKTLLSVNPNTQRKCVPIEALPVKKTSSRASSKPKQIVRTPLGFKSSSGATGTDAATPCKTITAKTSPKAKIKIPALASCKGTEKNPKKRVSPRLVKTGNSKEKDSNKISKTAMTANKKTTTTNKKQQKEVLEKIKENKKLLALLEPVGVKKPDTVMESMNKQCETIPIKEVQQTVPKKIKVASVKPNYKQKEKEDSSNKNIKSDEMILLKTNVDLSEPDDKETVKLKEKVSSEENDFLDDDDDDPLEDCVCVSITENDEKHFFTHVHQERKDTPKLHPSSESVSEHLKKFTMNVAIDANNTHTWRISEEYCLFSSSPVVSPSLPIRNIPKKRKIRITSSSISFDEVDNVKQQDETKSIDGTLHANRKEIESSGTKDKTTSTPSLDKTIKKGKTKTHNLDSNPTDKLEIEDIESILSHIHGV